MQPLKTRVSSDAHSGVELNTLIWNEKGQGPVLVFIHAASLCAGIWTPVISKLPRDCRIVAFDLRGHGDSDHPQGTEFYRWDLIANDIVRVLRWTSERFGGDVDACITHSFSGDCALMALPTTDIPLRKLILLDPVLADELGATVGGEALAKGTQRLGEKESAGFETPSAAEDQLDRCLKRQLFDGTLDQEARAAFSDWAIEVDDQGIYRLKCKRDNEAEIYRNRVHTAGYLDASNAKISYPVVLGFSEKRRVKPDEEAETALARDMAQAKGVLDHCEHGSLKELRGVGHFLVLERPGFIAEFLSSVID